MNKWSSLVLIGFILSACNAGPNAEDILTAANDPDKDFSDNLVERSSFSLISLRSNAEGMYCCRNIKEPLPKTQNKWVLSHYSCDELSDRMGAVADKGWFKLTAYNHPYQDSNNVWYRGERCFLEALDRDNLEISFGYKVNPHNGFGMQRNGDSIMVNLMSDAVFTSVDEIVKFDGPGCTYKATVSYRYNKHYLSKVDPDVVNEKAGITDFCMVKDNKGNWLLAD